MRREEFDHGLQPWLRLSLCAGVGALRAARLLEAFGSPQAVFQQDGPALAEVLGSLKLAQAVLGSARDAAPYMDRAYAWLTDPAPADDGLARAIWTLDDWRYPPGLKPLDDPPPVLYVTGPTRWVGAPGHQGDDEAADSGALPWWGQPAAMLAVVGSRQPTPQGVRHATQWSEQLAGIGVCIVSGLARGIDAAAHEGALRATDAGGDPAGPATIAVMGTGADRIYPSYHRELAHRIARRGLLMTEQPLGAPPLATHFPRRNRIITGLCQATLVVEATEKSGSLVSARLAVEQGRDVMAVPGSIQAPQSRGCHALIKQGAKLVEGIEDVLDELPLRCSGLRQPVATDTDVAGDRERAAAQDVAGRTPAGGDGDSPVSSRYRVLLEAMGYDPVGLEQLAERTGLATPALQAQLLELELSLQVARLPGGLFQRIGLA